MAESQSKHTKNTGKDTIYIFTKKEMCKKCKDECEEFDGLVPDCSVCNLKKLPHISQLKAIRVMGDAMRARGEQCSFTFQTLAVHGLRALLEIKK